jgi:hypothetical protein
MPGPDSAARLAVETASLATPRGRLIAFGVLAGFLALVGPHRLEGKPSLCLIRNITGHPCPACGMTRASSALLRGQVRTAAHYNKLVFPVAATLISLFVKDGYNFIHNTISSRLKSPGIN